MEDVLGVPNNTLQLVWFLLLAIGGWFSREFWQWWKERDKREDDQKQEKWAATDARHREFYDLIEKVTERSNNTMSAHTESLTKLTGAIRRMMDHEEKMLDSLSSMATRDENTVRVLVAMQAGQQEIQRSMNLLLHKLTGSGNTSGAGSEAYQRVLQKTIEDLQTPTDELNLEE
jgi:hypothetical protein